MKLLFLANRTPYPPYRGDKLKIYNLAKQLKSKHTLHLITFAQNKEDLSYKSELLKVFDKVHQVYLPKTSSVLSALTHIVSSMPLQVAYFKSAEMKHVLDHWLKAEHYDAIHVQHLRMAPYLLHRPQIKHAVLDLPDAFSLYWQRRMAFSKNIWVRSFENLEYKRLFKYEQATIGQYPLALVCSPEDQRYLQQTHHLNNIKVLPNGVDLAAFQNTTHDYAITNQLLFTGNMDYAPNVDAVQYFVQDIFPEIIKQIPEAHFTIAGQRPVKQVLALASNNITVTGFVPDLATMYAAASVVVAPLRFGAGTQNKVLEALAMGVPTVCTDVGFEGLGVASGAGVFKENTSDSFANRVVELLKNETLRAQTGRQGQVVLRSKFGWPSIALQLDDYLNAIASS